MRDQLKTIRLKLKQQRAELKAQSDKRRDNWRRDSILREQTEWEAWEEIKKSTTVRGIMSKKAER